MIKTQSRTMQVVDNQTLLLLKTGEGLRNGVAAIFSSLVAAFYSLWRSLLALVPTSGSRKHVEKASLPSISQERQQTSRAASEMPTVAEVNSGVYWLEHSILGISLDIFAQQLTKCLYD